MAASTCAGGSRPTSSSPISGHDAHQDHREVNQLTWNVFRDHLVLEYEIPKWDGDLGQPNVYMPLSKAIMEKKVALLDAHFGTQRSKDWFDKETFQGLARLQGHGVPRAGALRRGLHHAKSAARLSRAAA